LSLRERRIAGAVLDVLATPHAAALSARENERITELFVDNLRRYLDGEPLVNVIEPGVFY
jgi:phosphoglycerate dehydrogenase-like enzyme